MTRSATASPQWRRAQAPTLIADETMGELWLDGDIRQPFAVHGPAILLGSVGKTMWGGLRVGWIRADRTMIQRFVRERHSNDLGTPILDQLIVAKLLEDYDTILEERRALLRRGRAHLLDQLAAEAARVDSAGAARRAHRVGRTSAHAVSARSSRSPRATRVS